MESGNYSHTSIRPDSELNKMSFLYDTHWDVYCTVAMQESMNKHVRAGKMCNIKAKLKTRTSETIFRSKNYMKLLRHQFYSSYNLQLSSSSDFSPGKFFGAKISVISLSLFQYQFENFSISQLIDFLYILKNLENTISLPNVIDDSKKYS